MADNNNYKSPWGKKSSTTDTKSIEDFIRKSPENFNKFFGSNFSERGVILVVIAAIVVIWLLSGFYIVNEGEQAAVTRFGKFARFATAGPNYHAPYPIESITKVSVDQIQKEEIGFRSSPGNNTVSDTSKNNIPAESLMLTGDENIADINFFIQWRVINIKDYLYNVKNIRETVKSVAESAMREIIGNSTIVEAQTEGRAKVQQNTKDLLQKVLDDYKCGVVIENLQLLKVNPPAEVIDAFRDVQTARADMERSINQAEAYRNTVLQQAKGEAEKLIQEAQGYKAKAIETAKGEASKFSEIYAQYAKSKDVTRKRLYLETMEEVLSGMDKTVISGSISKSAIPYLPLNQLKNNKEQTDDR